MKSVYIELTRKRAIAKMITRCTLYMSALKIVGSLWVCPRLLSPKFLTRFSFRWMLWIHIQNLKFVALPLPEIIGDTPKNLGSLWICPGSLFFKILMGFVRMDPFNVPTKFEDRSFTHSWYNWGYPPNWAVSGYTHAPFSPKFLMGCCSYGSCQCTGQTWSP